jgi:hypothetical protein
MKAKLFAIAVIVILASHFFACSDSGDILTTGQKTNVTGRVIGHYFNAGAQFVTVRIEDKTVLTDSYGKFVINDVNVPYDVYITDSVNHTGSVYKNLTSSECWFQHNIENYIYTLSQASINVTLTNGQGTSSGWKSFFTDGKNVNSIGYNGGFQVTLADNNSVTGKVCVLLYTININGSVLSYDKFGYVDNVTIYPGASINLSFADSMLTFNPPESRVTGVISGLPPHSNSELSHYIISMSPRKANYYLTNSSFFLIKGNSFDFYVPSNIPINYFPMLNVYVSDSNSLGLFSCGVSYILPKNGATGLNVQIPQSPQLLSPPGLSYVDSNTVFTYSYSGTDRIFKITLSDSASKKINIYTTAENINMQNLWKLGLGKFNPNSTINYSVQVLGSYKSIDDYINPNYENIYNYSPVVIGNTFFMKP